MRICETLGEVSQGFVETLGGICEDSQGFMRLWERFCMRICETLGEDMQGFVRLWDSGFVRI